MDSNPYARNNTNNRIQDANLLFDEHHQGFWQHTISRHRVCSGLGLQRGDDGLQVGNVHHHCHPRRILRIDKRANVRDVEGSKNSSRFFHASQTF